MIKTKILTTVTIKKQWLDEIKEHIPGIEFDIERTTTPLKVYKNPQTNTNYAVWDYFRTLFPATGYRYRVYVMSDKERLAYGMTDHLAAYNNQDRDKVFDFYMTATEKNLTKAKKNGFKYNFARIFVHETTHGKEQEQGREYMALTNPDRTHDWEAQGRLKELAQEHFKLSLLQQLLELTKKLSEMLKSPSKPTKMQPLVERRVVSIIADMERFGLPVRLVQGYRSIEEQNKLYAQGRTTAGTIVTNAKGGESFHNYGVAVDFVFRKSGYNATDAQWNLLGDTLKKYGFEWGGDWKGFVDKPHGQLTLGYSLKDFQQGKVDYSKFN